MGFFTPRSSQMGIEMKVESYYFESSGREHTMDTLLAARRRLEELGLSHCLVPSRTGSTALMAADVFRGSGAGIIAITHQYGYMEPGEWCIEDERLAELEKLGVKVATCTMPLTVMSRPFRPHWKRPEDYVLYQTTHPCDVIADTLRLFGQGMKVAVEIVMMAADMGLVPVEKDLVSLGGTHEGLDTAIVVRAANTPQMFNLRVREIIAKPREF